MASNPASTVIRLRPMRPQDAHNLLAYLHEQGAQGYAEGGAHGLLYAVEAVLDDVRARLAKPKEERNER